MEFTFRLKLISFHGDEGNIERGREGEKRRTREGEGGREGGKREDG